MKVLLDRVAVTVPADVFLPKVNLNVHRVAVARSKLEINVCHVEKESFRKSSINLRVTCARLENHSRWLVKAVVFRAYQGHTRIKLEAPHAPLARLDSFRITRSKQSVHHAILEDSQVLREQPRAVTAALESLVC